VAAVSYSDLSLDVDKVHDDAGHRASVIAALASEIGAAPDFSDIQKFDRYYEFESFDMLEVCDQVASAVRGASNDGRLDAAVRTLGTQPPVTSTAAAAEVLLAKIDESQSAMKASVERRHISATDWHDFAAKNWKIWHTSGIRWVAEHIYPLAAPVGRMARRARIPI